MQSKVNLYYCSAEADEHHREALDRHLTTLKRQLNVEPWHPNDTLAGADRVAESHRRLAEADVIVLLLSTHLLVSCEAEINQALARLHASPVILIPVRVNPVDLSGSPLGELQALPRSGEFVGKARRKEQLWVEVVSGIRVAIEASLQSHATNEVEPIVLPNSLTHDQTELATKQQVDHLLAEIQHLKNIVAAQSTKNLAEQVRFAETHNPGLCFTIQTRASHTSYTISPKPGTDNLLIGHLVFPANTESGQQGIAKLNKALDEGTSVQFRADECQFESMLKLPWDTVRPDNGMLSLRPITPTYRNPLKMSCRYGALRTGRVSLAYMTILRSGRKEVEMRISDGRLAGAIYLLVDKPSLSGTSQTANTKLTLKCSARVDLDWTGLSPDIAVNTANLFLAAYHAAIKVEFLESGTLFSTTISTALPDKELLIRAKEILLLLITINREYNSSLRFPRELSYGDYKEIFLLAKLAERRKLSIPIIGGAVGFGFRKSDAIRLISHWNSQKLEKSSFIVNLRSYSHNILGIDVFIGDLTVHVKGAVPDFDIQEFLVRVEKLRPDEMVHLKFQCQELVHSLKKET